jgi:hypothetical protein
MRKTPSRWLRLEQFCGSAFSSSSYRRRNQLFLVSALESTDRGVVLGRYLRERVPLDIVEPKQGSIAATRRSSRPSWSIARRRMYSLSVIPSRAYFNSQQSAVIRATLPQNLLPIVNISY